MSQLSLPHRILRFTNKLRVLGPRQAFRSVTALFTAPPAQRFPLANADPDLMLASGVSAIRDFARKQSRSNLKKEDSRKDLTSHFPHVYDHSDGRSMRYAFFPALERSKGLVVVFHGYLGFEIYPLRYSWKHFDLLIPYDNFGWKSLGSWFWGTGGENYVEQMTQALIQKTLQQRGQTRWFCVGASMGGFAALYHGIKHAADGVYAMTPIIDLKSKIDDYRKRNIQTSYTEVAAAEDARLQRVPDIYAEARAAQSLPPLFLIQNQYDRTNPFGSATLPLLQCYEDKKGWLGLRVQPAIGHQGHDGSYEEAQYFFEMIASKTPPRVVDFYNQDEGG
ncbi:MAG: hypothetical protein KF821_05315 [Anaerolineales bacterium]|nr:hypothetical protein [Anaerolineales bacterium]